MRVGFDVSGLVGKKPLTGIQRYQLSLLNALVPYLESRQLELYLYVAFPVAQSEFDKRPYLTKLRNNSRIHWRFAPFPRAWYRIGFGLAMQLDRIDIVHFTAPLLPYYCPIPSVVTFHDLAAFSLPGDDTRKEQHYLRETIDAAKRAKVIIADSISTTDELKRYVHRNDAIVINLGVDLQRFSRRPGEEVREVCHKYGLSKYILCVGTIQTRKNHLRLVHAFEQIAAEISHKLVIVGTDGSGSEQFRHYLQEHPNDRIVHLGYVDEDELIALYSGADVFILPSLWEGFGLPILEAMACGIPVITSNTSSLKEVAGSAALLVDPTSIDDIANKLLTLINDTSLQHRLIEAGYARVETMSWASAAHKTIVVYENLSRDGHASAAS